MCRKAPSLGEHDRLHLPHDRAALHAGAHRAFVHAADALVAILRRLVVEPGEAFFFDPACSIPF
jgi:hypothetical protein